MIALFPHQNNALKEKIPIDRPFFFTKEPETQIFFLSKPGPIIFISKMIIEFHIADNL